MLVLGDSASVQGHSHRVPCPVQTSGSIFGWSWRHVGAAGAPGAAQPSQGIADIFVSSLVRGLGKVEK